MARFRHCRALHRVGITRDIDASDFLVADVTVLNFNVMYEVGFAIGRKKRLLLIRHSALEQSEEVRALGIFDTIGHTSYENSGQLLDLLKAAPDLSPIEVGTAAINRSAPVYLLLPRFKTDQITHIFSRIKKAKLDFAHLIRLNTRDFLPSRVLKMWRPRMVCSFH